MASNSTLFFLLVVISTICYCLISRRITIEFYAEFRAVNLIDSELNQLQVHQVLKKLLLKKVACKIFAVDLSRQFNVKNGWKFQHGIVVLADSIS